MVSAKQLEANRLNAKSSRGPKTAAGKAVAAQNSLQHGLLSQEAILPGENASDYESFAEKLYAELQPIGELESALVGRIGGLLWRLRRVGRLEAGILMWEHADLKSYSSDEGVRQSVYIFGESHLDMQGELYTRGADTLTKLSRYERSIDKSLYKAMHELQRLQAPRKGKHSASVVLDVQVEQPAKTEAENNPEG